MIRYYEKSMIHYEVTTEIENKSRDFIREIEHNF